MEKTETLGQKFKTPEEEIRFLREQIARKEMQMESKGETMSQEQIVTQKIEEYKKVPAEAVLETDYRMAHTAVEGFVLDLAPEPHDK
mgnify:CR=1 FL=1